MSKYAYAKQTLPDWDAKTAEDIKIAIKAYCLRHVLRHTEKQKIMKAVYKEIDLFRGEFDEDEQPIADGYAQELREFFEEAYDMAFQMVARMTPYMFAQSLVNPEMLTNAQKRRVVENSEMVMDLSGEKQQQAVQRAIARAKDLPSGAGYEMATAGNVQYSDVHQEVKSRMEHYGEFAKSKNYLVNVNPRSVTEMGVRFERYLRKKERLIKQGVRFVFVPAHANCSGRCQPWQGKLYSLDGTTGTHDGRRFRPIEEAAEDQVVHGKRDPSRIYANGLFAYNCRHDLVPYEDGQNITQIPDDVIENTRNNEIQQRAMERDIRATKERMILYNEVYNQSRNENLVPQINELNKLIEQKERAYRKFCRMNNLVIYEERLEIVGGENIYIRTVGAKDPIVKYTKRNLSATS